MSYFTFCDMLKVSTWVCPFWLDNVMSITLSLSLCVCELAVYLLSLFIATQLTLILNRTIIEENLKNFTNELGVDVDRNCPYIFEAIIALAELGVSAKDIISLFPQVCYISGSFNGYIGAYWTFGWCFVY